MLASATPASPAVAESAAVSLVIARSSVVDVESAPGELVDAPSEVPTLSRSLVGSGADAESPSLVSSAPVVGPAVVETSDDGIGGAVPSPGVSSLGALVDAATSVASEVRAVTASVLVSPLPVAARSVLDGASNVLKSVATPGKAVAVAGGTGGSCETTGGGVVNTPGAVTGWNGLGCTPSKIVG